MFVVDGSPDDSYAQLRDGLVQQPFASQLLLLSRNFGSFAAIRAGLASAAGDTFAVMAADLQEPPELLLGMQDSLQADEADVVFGQRTGRKDPWLTRTLSQIFWWCYRRCVVSQMPPGGVDIFACNRLVRDNLLRFTEQNSSLVAQVFWLGFRRKMIPYIRRERQHGISAWTMAKKLRYLSDSVFSFTDLPIRLLVYLGASVAVGSGLFAVLVLFCRLAGLINVSGYTVTILAIVFLGACNLLATGMVGSYAWRAYENSKERPLHVLLRQHVYVASPPVLVTDVQHKGSP